MNIDIIITAVLLVLFVVIVAVFIFSLKDYITNVDEKVDNLKNDYVPLKKHNQDIDQSKNEDSRLHTRIDSTNEKIDLSFDGNYDNLKNKPDLFDGDYMKLKNKPSNSGDYNKLINKPQLFDGEYDSLTNKPDLFDKDYNKLKNKPALFDKDYNKLINKPDLFDKDYNKLKNKPDLFDKDYNKLINKPDLFDKDYNKLTNKPDLFDGSYNNLTNKPAHYPSKWDMIDDKPASFANVWDDIEGKPSDFPTSWELIKNKPAATAPTGPIYDDSEIRGMIGGKAPLIHTHNISDIQGYDSNLSKMLTDYLANYALLEHTHTMGNIQGLSDNLNTKSTIGHRHEASDINNLQSVIDSNLPNLSGYATTTALTSGLGTKQGTLTAGDNINISGNTISATQPDVSGYATASALTTGLAGKQGTITGAITTVTDVDLGANKVIVSNSSGKIQGSSVSKSILNFLSGLTGNVQTQINNKQDKLTTAQTDALTELASGGGGERIIFDLSTATDADVPYSGSFWRFSSAEDIIKDVSTGKKFRMRIITRSQDNIDQSAEFFFKKTSGTTLEYLYATNYYKNYSKIISDGSAYFDLIVRNGVNVFMRMYVVENIEIKMAKTSLTATHNIAGIRSNCKAFLIFLKEY
jgi:cell division protein FtsL